MAIQISGTTVVDNSRNFNAGIGTFTDLNVPPQPITFSPTDGETSVAFASNISITFNQLIQKGTGNITLRDGSAAGTIIQTIDVTSASVTISSGTATIDPPDNLPSLTDVFVVVDAGAFTSVSFNSPTPLIDTYNFVTIVQPDLLLFSWGNNAQGRLGHNDTIRRSSPVQIPGTTWGSITGGAYHSLATKTDGTLWSWGLGSYGRLGLSDTINVSSPVQIPGTTWNVVRAGFGQLATKTDGTLWIWGSNSSGQISQNNITPFSSPVQIPGTTWSTEFGYISSQSAAAIKTDGTLWAWGGGGVGELGQNNAISRSSPVQIPGTTWRSVANTVSNGGALATKTDGTLWSWGRNGQGQLGQNNITYFSSPVQIPGTSWSDIISSGYSSRAIKTDGTLWAWGRGDRGELGQNDRIRRSSPVQIPGTSWNKIIGGSYRGHTLATKTDGTLWSWGGSLYGPLGQNNLTYFSSPVQIPGTPWSSISGNDHSLAIKEE